MEAFKGVLNETADSSAPSSGVDGIQIALSGLGGANSPTGVASGVIVHTITKQEAIAFGVDTFQQQQQMAHDINEKILNNGDRWCDYAGLQDNVKDYDIYYRQNWKPVTCTYTPKEVKLISSNPNLGTISSLKTITPNYNEERVVVTITGSLVTTDTVESNWSETNTFAVGQSITYQIGILGLGGQGQTSFTYTNSSTRGGSQVNQVAINFATGVQVPLAGNHYLESWITLIQGEATYEVTFDLTLEGILCWAYDKKYKDHWFWGYDINVGLEKVNKPKVITIKQLVTIKYNTSASLVIGESYPLPPILPAV